MNTAESNPTNDVLHAENPTKLTAEEIAKAVAHHNRHHGGDHSQNPPAAKMGAGKKKMPAKPK